MLQQEMHAGIEAFATMLDAHIQFSSILLSSAIILTCVAVFIYLKKHARLRAAVNKIPGPSTLPLLGNVHCLVGPRGDLLPKLLKLLDKYLSLGMARLWFGPNPYVALYKAEHVETLLNNTKHIEKSPDYKFLYSWLRLGLLTSSGEKWRQRRRLLTPAFHFRILEDFMPIFNEQSEVLVKVLKKEVGNPSFDIFPYISRAALDMICETAMGCSVNAQLDGQSEYVSSIHTASAVLFNRMVFPWLQYDFVFNNLKVGKDLDKALNVLKGFTEKVIERRRREFAIGSKKTVGNSEDSVYGKKQKLAFLDLLLQYSDDGRVLTNLDIQEEVDTFMFEGHDTTAAGMFWSVYFLGLNADVQQKAYQEIIDVLGDSEGPISSDQLKELKYLEAVVKESLRLCPSVPVIARSINEDLKIGDYVIPAGVRAVVIAYLLHRDPKYFPNPETFDPERFMDDNTKRHPYAYVPFSAGPRNCIGQKFAMMEEKTVLAHFLKNYQVTVTRDIIGHSKAIPEIVLRPSSALEVKIEKRE